MNLGSINENDFKESKAVAIAKNIIEENRCFKTFSCEMDKRPNLDGHMSFIYKNQERMIIEVQIKTLPQNYCYQNLVYRSITMTAIQRYLTW